MVDLQLYLMLECLSNQRMMHMNDAYQMYNAYARRIGFSIRKSTTRLKPGWDCISEAYGM